MSNLVPATREFHGHPLTVATVNGQPWLQANDLTGPTGNTKRAIQKMVATLPESERCELEVRTSGGTQTATFVSQAGALEVVLRSKTPMRLEFTRWVCALAAAPAPISPDVQAQLSAQTTALQALHARLLRLEHTQAKTQAKQALPKPRTAALADLPETEAHAFLQAWRQQFGGQHVSSADLHEMATAGGHMESLFAACATTRGEQTRLGIWLKSLPGVRYHRPRHRIPPRRRSPPTPAPNRPRGCRPGDVRRCTVPGPRRSASGGVSMRLGRAARTGPWQCARPDAPGNVRDLMPTGPVRYVREP